MLHYAKIIFWNGQIGVNEIIMVPKRHLCELDKMGS